jgi:predicted HicB family RNase H-like nuclease
MSILKAGRPTTSQREKALASVQDTQEESIRMNVNISKSFHRQIKQWALDEDTTVTDIVMKALKAYMNK